MINGQIFCINFDDYNARIYDQELNIVEELKNGENYRIKRNIISPTRFTGDDYSILWIQSQKDIASYNFNTGNINKLEGFWVRKDQKANYTPICCISSRSGSRLFAIGEFYLSHHLIYYNVGMGKKSETEGTRFKAHSRGTDNP